eukprot:7179897-Alexandrium_andersonii.AAC.1
MPASPRVCKSIRMCQTRSAPEAMKCPVSLASEGCRLASLASVERRPVPLANEGCRPASLAEEGRCAGPASPSDTRVRAYPIHTPPPSPQ